MSPDRRIVLAGITAASFATILPKKVAAMTPYPHACDCHVHVIGPRDRYPMVASRAYTPGEASVDALRAHLAGLGLSRVVLIQPSVYGTDNRYMLDALDALGDDARGIAVIDPAIAARDLATLDHRRVRGVRINIESTRRLDVGEARARLAALGARLADLGWHLQVYAAAETIAALADDLAHMPVPVVLDHFAMLSPGLPSDPPMHETHAAVGRLLRMPHVHVKISGPYRLPGASSVPDAAITALAAAFVAVAPDRVLWGSDWPHTARAPGVPPTQTSAFRVNDDRRDLDRLGKLGSADTARRILVDNPARLFGFAKG